jgi:hypothetical protein
MTFRYRTSVVLAVFALLALAALPATAQEMGNIRSITYTKVKADRVDDYRDAVKQIVALYQKIGYDRGSTVWLSQTGDREFARVTYHKTWSELDFTPNPKFQPHLFELGRIMARIADTTESSHRVIDELQPDLSIQSPTPTLNTMPKMARVLVSSVRADKISDYTALIKNDVMPVYKKAGTKMYFVSRTRYGGATNQFRSVIFMDQWADLDGGLPIRKAMGEAGYNALMAKIGALVTRSEATMYSFQKDLSYLPAPAKASNNE